ncbi:MAG: winged helix-turn-helix transcriptional regulator, partial [Methylococcaceae bacterium]
TNILASRLDLLLCLKLIERVNPDASSRNNAYRLTEGGAALRPVLEALAQWAGTHLSDFHANIVKL